MRITMDNGRSDNGKTFSKKHNDRNFNLDLAEHIDQSQCVDNVYECIYNGMTFEEAEKKYYKEKLGDFFQGINDRYKKNRHPEKQKSIDQYINIEKYAPESTWMQIGNLEETVSPEIFKECIEDFKERQTKWLEEHNNPFIILDSAVHVDEYIQLGDNRVIIPHFHQRRVWIYEEEGINKIGQEKALEKAGYNLPNPDKPQSKTNNRKMLFDADMRKLWLQVCLDHKLEVEKEPDAINSKVAKNLYQHIKDEHNRAKSENELLKNQNEEIVNENFMLKSSLKYVQAQKDELIRERDELAYEVESLKEDIAELSSRKNELKNEIDAIAAQYEFIEDYRLREEMIRKEMKRRHKKDKKEVH